MGTRVPTIYVLSENMKIVEKIKLKIVIFTAVKNRCILHGRVFVMLCLQVNETFVFVANVTDYFKKWLNTSEDIRLKSSILNGVS